MDELNDFVSPDYVKEETDEEKAHSLPKLFDYINDLSFKKENLAKRVQQETGKFPSEFVPYIAIKAFGNFKDTVILANEINTHFNEIPSDMQYLFYLHGIPRRKRFSKFYSTDTDRETAVSALAKYFQWGCREAEANMKMFNKEEIAEIIRRLNDDRNKKR